MLICFPTYARKLAHDDRWRVKVAGMLTAPLPESSRRRSAALAMLRRLLEIGPEHENEPIFRTRVGAFLFERIVGGRVLVDVGGHERAVGPTDRLGHFEATFDLDPADLPYPSEASCPSISYRARLDQVDVQERRLQNLLQETADSAQVGGSGRYAGVGRVECVSQTGFSVISDIDDTVKLTNVSDRRELLANTFLRQFQPIPGMVELYQQWRHRGTAFHYVSASPWQLAGCLAGFFDDAGLPTGSMHLSMFRLKDMTPLGRLSSKKRSKRRSTEQIVSDFPGRRFVLIGDSGEKDPEIYAAVARRFPEQVVGIAIREVAGKPRSKSLIDRVEHLRRRLPPKLLSTFREAEELGDFVAAVTR